MSVLTNNMSDIINIPDRAIMEEIAKTDDHPVLMINQNLYTAKAKFPNGELYKEWRAINQKMIEYGDGKILWSMPVQGQILHNGKCQTLLSLIHISEPTRRS